MIEGIHWQKPNKTSAIFVVFVIICDIKTTEANTSHQNKIQAPEEDNFVLSQQLDWFIRQLFGHKSEKQLLKESSVQGL